MNRFVHAWKPQNPSPELQVWHCGNTQPALRIKVSGILCCALWTWTQQQRCSAAPSPDLHCSSPSSWSGNSCWHFVSHQSSFIASSLLPHAPLCCPHLWPCWWPRMTGAASQLADNITPLQFIFSLIVLLKHRASFPLNVELNPNEVWVIGGLLRFRKDTPYSYERA